MQLGSASSSGGASENAIRSEINVTPLVDVCLVLLIIFMVVTPLLQEGVDVQLPETQNPARMPEGENQLDLAIRADGSVFVGQKWMTPDNLPRALADIHTATPGKQIVIKADRRLKYKQVREVMRLVNEAGFSGVGLETKREEGAGPPGLARG
jgi:biopolymer transport protein ExbD